MRYVKPYDNHIKATAIEHVVSGNRSIKEVAYEVGVQSQTVSKWLGKYFGDTRGNTTITLKSKV